MINYLLNLVSLQGRTDPAALIEPKGMAGTFLKNILEWNSLQLKHPQFIHRYLESKNW